MFHVKHKRFKSIQKCLEATGFQAFLVNQRRDFYQPTSTAEEWLPFYFLYPASIGGRYAASLGIFTRYSM